MNERIRLIKHECGCCTSVEADDDVSAEEVIAFLQQEEPALAEKLARTIERVRRAEIPGVSDTTFFRREQP